ncbi:MAG TPA: DUF2029 domain-containing protein [bacterium]|nr:DUF2029 domain-containing protein [bacterium]
MPEPSVPRRLPPRRWLPWLCGLVAFVIAAKKLIGGYDDLGIYLDVAREFQQGGFDLCRDRANSGPWVYPPCAVLPFVLLEGSLGNEGARWAWCLLLGVATALLVKALADAVRPIGGLTAWQWAVFGFLFQRTIAQNLSHGQLSLWVGTLVAMGIAALVNGRDLVAGIWLGLATALKVTPGLFLPALLLMARPRAAGSMAATVALAVGLATAPFCGWSEHVRHLEDFVDAALAAVRSPDDAAITAGRTGPSIAGTVDYLLQPRPADREGHTVNLLDVDDDTLRVARGVWSTLLGALLLAWFVRARRPDGPRRLLEQSAVVTMAITFFSPLVRTYHLAAMLAAAVLFCRGPRSRRDWLWFATASTLAFAMTLRQRNLIGVPAWRYLGLGGALHFALVAMTVWLARTARRP